MIVFQKVTKTFLDGSYAVNDISFQIKKGEFVFFIGPSGAGKTTVMRLLRREIVASEGEVLIKDKNLAEMAHKEIPVLRRQVAVCFQDFKLLNDRTVSENVALSLEVDSLPDDLVKEKTRHALKSVGLENKGNLFPVQLSGGELQRTGIARAIVNQPDILLADEPTGNLDPDASFQILKLFKEINLAGTTVLIATHNAEMVNSMAERVIVLNKGKITNDNKKGKYKIKL